MKRTLAILTAIAMLLLLAACGQQATPVLKAVLRDENSQAAEDVYCVVYDNGESAVTDAFEPDDMQFYTAPFDAFDASLADNKVGNTLTSTTLVDAQGKRVEADAAMTSMMQLAARIIDHSIFEFTILTNGERYFAFVKLNVVMQTPCILYEYDGGLTELCRWDDMELVGLALE